MMHAGTTYAPALQAGASCTTGVDSNQTPISSISPYLTVQDAEDDNSNDARTDLLDSDARLNGAIAEVDFTAAEINHSLDIGFAPVQVTLDFGDLPDGNASGSPNYNTDVNGVIGPRHIIVNNLRMGTAVDAEGDGQPTAAANGDDTDTDGDDEDGVTLPTFYSEQSASVTLTVTNNTGGPATLYGFIDFDGDGAFTSAGEVVTTTVATGTNDGVASLLFSVPADADTAQQLGARFRLSTDTGLGPDGLAVDGEVEDYLISVQPGGTANYSLDKWLNSPNPARSGEVISFTIRITNTGELALSTIPLQDLYDSDYLAFISAVPTPDDNADDGTITWSDLTQPAPYGLGSSLSPGPDSFFDVFVEFVAKDDTYILPDDQTENRAETGGVRDANGTLLPSQQATATVEIILPTAVDMEATALHLDGNTATIQWRTANETNIVAFHVHRTDGAGRHVRLTEEPIPARHAGQPHGADYRCENGSVPTGERYHYELESLSLDGHSSTTQLGLIDARPTIYLPLVTR